MQSLLAAALTPAPDPAAEPQPVPVASPAADSSPPGAAAGVNPEINEDAAPTAETPPEGHAPADDLSADPEPAPSNTKDWPESATKRINKLTAQREELKRQRDAETARRAELEQQLQQLQQQSPPLDPRPSSLDPGQSSPDPRPSTLIGPGDPVVSVVEDVPALDNLARSCREVLETLDAYQRNELDEPERVAFAAALVKNGWSPEGDEPSPQALRQLRRTVSHRLNEEIPARRSYLTARPQATAVAEQAFPWLKDRKSREYGEVQKVVAAMPEIKRYPQWELIAGTYVLGLEALNERIGKARNGNGHPPAASPKPPRTVNVPPAVPPSVPVDAEDAALRGQIQRGASASTMQDYFTRKLASRGTQPASVQ
jgi:hypothetical protein